MQSAVRLKREGGRAGGGQAWMVVPKVSNPFVGDRKGRTREGQPTPNLLHSSIVSYMYVVTDIHRPCLNKIVIYTCSNRISE
jgi:hypothetical protein